MAIPKKNRSKRNPISSPSSKSKLNQKKWEFKRKTVEKRLMDLANTQTKNKMLEQGDSVTMDMAIVCYRPKERSTSDLHSCDDLSSSAMERAKELQKNLPKKFPSFVKLMSRSHVTKGFWLGVPKQFCDDYLPEKDVTMVLIDENEQGYNTNYLAGKGLSGGWKGFSIAHKLLEGDVVVFQLIEPCKFKTYIVRARRFTEVDGATSLFNVDFHHEPIEAVKIEEPQEDQDNTDTTRDKSPLDFKNVKRFQDFSIHINGLIMDSEIPKHIRTKYYKLCKSQGMFLHENLVNGLNSKLVVGMIFETINIADAIRAAKASTPRQHLESWDRTLKGFEDLGMAVGPMRDRINKLMSLYSESSRIVELMRARRDEAVGVMKELSDRLLSVKACVDKLDADIDDALNGKNQGLIGQIACAPW